MLMMFSLILVVSAFKLYKPVISGWIGERRVRGVLNRLDSNKFICFHDVLLPIKGETTQIDHLVFSGNKCFVIETKAHGGWIFGLKDDEVWTQSFNKKSKKKFQNPIRQNYKHLLAVRNLVGSLSVEDIVVFTRATFKSGRIENVLYIRELKRFLKENAGISPHNYENEIQTLIDSMIVGKSEGNAHVRRLQEKFGGRWRIPVAHSLMVAGVGLFLFNLTVFSPLHNITQSIKFGKNIQNLDKQNSYDIHTQREAPGSHVVKSYTQTKVASPKGQPVNMEIKERLFSPVVNGFMKGKAVISTKGSLYVLTVGEVTSDGWKLVEANSKSAIFLHSSGKTAKIEAR